MIALISPAKTLDFESDLVLGNKDVPYFLHDAERVNRKLRSLSRKKLRELQSISSQLASVNHQRNQEWNTDHSDNTRQAALCFKGDVYLGMEAQNWSEQDMEYAVNHLRILSGLYGILKPNDLIKPYRLEMGTALPVGRRKDLYAFWADKLKKYFNTEVGKEELLINLASNEYFNALKQAKLKNPVINVEFKDYSNGSYKVLSFFAKKARGMMADYLIRNRIDNPDGIKSFNTAGYYFDAKSSSNDKFVFLRDKT